MPRVAVVLPTYNGRSRGQSPARPDGYICEAIESVLAQTFADFELIAVDDGSTDHTGDVLQRFSSDPRVKVLHQANRGLSAARNAGIPESATEYVAFLDDDDVWVREKLARQVELLADPENAAVGMVCSSIELIDGEGKPIGLQGHSLGRDVYRELFYENVIDAPSSVMVRRSVLDDVGLFRENLRSVEDRDLWIRIAQRYEIRSISEPLVRYRVQPFKMTNVHSTMEEAEIHVLQLALESAPERIRAESDRILATTYQRFAAKHFSLGNYSEYRRFDALASAHGKGGGSIRRILSRAPWVIDLARSARSGFAPSERDPRL